MDFCADATATNPLFSTSRTWEVSSRDENHTFGLGLRWDFGRARLDTNFTRALGRTRIGYAYDAAALGMSAQQVALAGEGLPEMAFAQGIFDASVLVPVNASVAMRFLVRHETGRVRDWHYDGIADNPMPTATSAYLDSGPRDYRATLFGLFFLIRL
jgi:putative beta-barrel porin MtrB/PioB